MPGIYVYVTHHDLRDHLPGDILRVARRHPALLVQRADLLVDLAPHRVEVAALHLRRKARELALLRLRVHLLRRVPIRRFRGRLWRMGILLVADGCG